MTTLAEDNLPPLPEWIRFGVPSDAHPAAFEAWLHADSRCVLLKLWDGDTYLAGAGAWDFEVRHPDGRRRLAWVAWLQPPTDEASILQSAAAAVTDLTRRVVQAKQER